MLIAFLCCAIAFSNPGSGQQPATPMIGFLSGFPSAYILARMPPFREGLNFSGYVEGRNVEIEYHLAEGQYDQLPKLAADLANRKVTVIVTSGGVDPVKAAKAATATIPIVFGSAGDPVKAGIVASLDRPGANVTGISLFGPKMEAERLRLLHQMVPDAGVIAVLVNPASADVDLELRHAQQTASQLGQQIYVAHASTAPEIDDAFATIVKQQAGALLVTANPLFASRGDQLVALAARYKLPTIYSQREIPEGGGLISYAPDYIDEYRQIGFYAGKILKGAKPADLPIMRPTKFDLVLNLKTAKTLGLVVPPAIVSSADEVVD